MQIRELDNRLLQNLKNEEVEKILFLNYRLIFKKFLKHKLVDYS